MKVTSRTQPVAVLMVLTTLPACVPVVELAGAFADVPTVSRPQVTHTDRNPIPVSLPERVGDRLVFEPVERSEKAAEVFQWVGLAWNLGVFNPLVGLLTPDYSFSGWGFCW